MATNEDVAAAELRAAMTRGIVAIEELQTAFDNTDRYNALDVGADTISVLNQLPLALAEWAMATIPKAVQA